MTVGSDCFDVEKRRLSAGDVHKGRESSKEWEWK
jgi:hypothetical protein